MVVTRETGSVKRWSIWGLRVAPWAIVDLDVNLVAMNVEYPIVWIDCNSEGKVTRVSVRLSRHGGRL